MILNVPLWEHLGMAPLLGEMRKMGEASARALDEQILGRLNRTLPPVEALDSRQRARLSGYLQMHEEVSRALGAARELPAHAIWPVYRRIEEAGFYYGVVPDRPAHIAEDQAAIWELSKLSGHTWDLVQGVIADWCFIVHGNPTREDWRRIWTGE